MKTLRPNSPAIARRLLWGAYAFVGVLVLCPVALVVWLVREAVANERLVAQQLLREAAERQLEAAEDALFSGLRHELADLESEAAERGVAVADLLPELVRREGVFAISSWGEPQRREDRVYDSQKARAFLGNARRAASEQPSERLAALLADPALPRLHFDDGRSAAAMAALLLTEQPQEALSAEARLFVRQAALDYQSFSMPSSQRRYLMKRAILAVDGSEIAPLLAAEEEAARWRAALGREARFPPEHYLSVGDDWVALADLGEGYALLYRKEEFIRKCSRLVESAAIRLLDSGEAREALGPDALVERVRRPLGFLTLVYVGSQTTAFDGSSLNRDLLYVWMGFAALAAAILAGFAIVGIIRRQATEARTRNDLVATVTHELKTPVSSIRLLVDTLLDERRADVVDRQEYLEMIGRENRRLGQLIDNFLSFSRMERNRAAFDLQPRSPETIAREAEQAFRDRFKDQAYSLELDLEPGVRPVMCDADAIGTVLANLLENAFKYGDASRRIVLRTSCGERGGIFKVVDFGRGIPRKEQRKIFRKFYQVGRDDARHSGSVGLGLSIVAFIVSKHGGTIDVESEPARGSAFTVTIPYA